MADGLAEHTTPPHCAMQLRPMLRLEGVEGNGKKLQESDHANTRVAVADGLCQKSRFILTAYEESTPSV